MKTTDIADSLFWEAVLAVDAGDISRLELLLSANPQLVKEPLSTPNEKGYFKNPYLLWFVADNPIRHGKLPANIVEVTRLLLNYVEREAPESFQLQVDYALGLVVTGRTPKECGVQLEMTDLLIDSGARVGSVMGALASQNTAVARHLIDRGAVVNLAAAICLNLKDKLSVLSQNPSQDDLQLALVAAAFYGDSQGLSYLLELGADPDLYLDPAKSDGFHAHGTALHQAVSSGSLEAVKVLVEAGARLDTKDRIFNGTPLEWAQHMDSEASESGGGRYSEIIRFFRSQ